MKTKNVDSITTSLPVNAEYLSSATSVTRWYSYLINLWRYLSNLGIKEGIKPSDFKRIRLTNQFAVFGLISCSLEIPFYMYLGAVTSVILIAIIDFSLGVVLVLNRYYLSSYAKIFLFIMVDLILIYSAGYLGKEGGLYIGFFSILIGPFILFDPSEKKTIIALTFMVLISVYVALYCDLSVFYDPSITSQMKKFVFQSSLLSSLVAVIACVNFLVKENSASEKRLNELNSRLRNETHEAKKVSIDLENINKELDQFAYVVSHDLKAPLRAINNLSLWIEEDLSTNANQGIKDNMDLLRKRVGRMEALIAGILEYSKVGRQANKIEKIDSRKLVLETVDFLYPPETFKVVVQEDMPEIEADKLKLQQVFANLISNAVKYHHTKNGTITIGCKKSDNHYQFSVTDDGPGIDPQYHQKIFDIFQTLQARDKVESTGIGLAIVKKIINEGKGDIWIESQLGKGSSFIFSWPVISNEG